MPCLQSLMVAKAKEELEQEILIKEEEKQKYLAERAPPLNTGGLNLQQLQVIQPLLSSYFSFLFNFFNPPLSSATMFFKGNVKNTHTQMLQTACFVHIRAGSLQRAP